MQRLVYNPRIDCYIKADTGVYDISPYVVGCMVNRKVNQVSNAQVDFRNPDMMFTEHKYKDPLTGKQSVGPMFHPQDPIIITMTRLRDHPIQVFTGYCDTTPYLQLFPGIASIDSSCTLKRLQYTYWDPGVQFVWDWLQNHGWQVNTGIGGITNLGSKNNGEGDNLESASGHRHMTDGSFGRLLFDFMTEIGGWDKETIYIEKLPKSIVDLVTNLYEQFKQESEQASNELQDVIRQIVGTSALGGGSHIPGGNTPLTGNTNAQKALGYFVAKGFTPEGACGAVGVLMAESGSGTEDLSTTIPNQQHSGATGLCQWLNSRLVDLHTFATADGRPWDDLSLQLDFTWHELTTSYTSVLHAMTSATDPVQAAITWANDYEISGVPSEGTIHAAYLYNKYGHSLATPPDPHTHNWNN